MIPTGTSSIVLLMFGSALILIGLFGLVEFFIRALRRRVSQRTASEDPASPSLAPTDYDLELLVVQTRGLNIDGRSRQEIIRRLQVGEPVALVPEADEFDGDEIRVDAPEGTIGYIPHSKVPTLLRLITTADIHSEVRQIFPGESSTVRIGVSLWR